MTTRKPIFAASLALALSLASLPALALEVLLTNDDGFDAPGIEALRAALVREGHDVTLFAPSSNRSGSSASLTLSDPIRVRRVAPKVFSVDASPASTVILGTARFVRDPDLIVSGINNGANIGPSTTISGTVGATIAAISQIRAPTPAIAVSTDLPGGDDPRSARNLQHFRRVADFTARLVRRFVRDGRVVGLEGGEALNVNYPPLAPAAVRGVRVAVQGQTLLFAPSFEQVSPGVFRSNARPVRPTRDVPRSDSVLFYRGFVTVVPIDGDYTADADVFPRVGGRLTALRP